LEARKFSGNAGKLAGQALGFGVNAGGSDAPTL
jgi:hypothetical protein